VGERTGIAAWLELARVSNVPTVWSNSLVGAALAATTGLPWTTWAVAATACSMLYVAGMIHNDVVDVAVDRMERPGRPIPSGRVSQKGAAIAAGLLMLVGVHLLWLASLQAVLFATGLAVMIVSYNLLHRVSAWTVLLMAGCRAMVYVTAAGAVAWPLPGAVWVFAAVLGAYVVVISLIARGEADSNRRVRIVVAMICAISLLDAAILLALGEPLAAGVAAACFACAAIMQRRILGT
jgi:4-hydroxybenzoate polyprenyltransferase